MTQTTTHPTLYNPWPDLRSQPDGWPDSYVDAADYFALAARLAEADRLIEWGARDILIDSHLRDLCRAYLERRATDSAEPRETAP